MRGSFLDHGPVMAANSFRLRTFGGLHLERSDGRRVPGEALQRATAEGRRAVEQAYALDPTDDLLESTAHAAAIAGAPRVAATRFDSLGTGEGLDWDGYAIRGLGRYRAAVAWEQAGDSAKAAAAYRAFLEAWRQGDPDLRPVRHARRQLGRSSRAQ